VDTQKEIASQYAVTAMPTFMIFKQGKMVEKVQGADPRKLQDVVRKLAAEADSSSSSAGFGGSSSGSSWRVGDLPKGYGDVTDQVDLKGLELLNADGEFGGVRVLFEDRKPSGLLKGKATDKPAKDWVESDTDEQLMMFMPFQSILKVHTLQVSILSYLIEILYANQVCRLPRYLQPPKMTQKSPCDQRQSTYTQIALISLASRKRKMFRQHKPLQFQPKTGT